MADNNNELISVEENEISQYLEQCGIHGEWLNQYINPEKMPKLGYSEVASSDIGALDMAFSHMPGMITIVAHEKDGFWQLCCKVCRIAQIRT